MSKIDMHVHTKASDGILSPKEAVEWAFRNGLKGISITDHDTVDGIEEACLTAAEYDSFHVIPGIEFSTICNEEEVHILGYHIDYHNDELVALTTKIRDERLNRGEKMIEKLNQLHYSITLEEVLGHTEGGVIGRPHIARVLAKKGYVGSLQEAFEKLLGKGKPAFIERFKLSPKEAVSVIERAGGIAVLAHPGLLKRNINIMELLNCGIQGIEVYHIKHTATDNRIYLEIAQKYELYITGGSDYHDTFIHGIPAIGSISVLNPFENK